MSDEQPDARWITTHLANQTQPCLRCGHPTVHRAVLMSETGQPRLAQPRCRGCTGPHHRAEHEPDGDDEQNTDGANPGQPGQPATA